MGPDSHSLELHMNKSFLSKIYLNTKISWHEYGASDINDWPLGMLSSNNFNFGYSQESFPSKPVNSDLSFNCNIDYVFTKKIKSTLKVNFSTMNNNFINFVFNVSI